MTDLPDRGNGRRRLPRLTANKEGRRLSNVYIFLVLFAVAALGYIGGMYNAQILGTVLPIFGVKSYSGIIDLSSVQNTYRLLKANYDGTISDQALIDGANKGLVAAVNDTYTVYFNQSDAKAFSNDLSGTIGGGIGAEISQRNSQPTIVKVLDNNPAKNAGLMAGDVITKINDVSVVGQSTDVVVTKIRGEVGTTVKVEVSRNGEAMTFTITRAIVSNPSVTSSVSNGLGIITISRFDENTADEARTAAQSLKSQNVTSVILDLRDNGGGYLDAAQAVAGLWLNDQVVVSEKTNGKTVDTLYSTSNPILAGLPTVVLVNGGSASASEIVTGALKDHKVATIVGEKTFGKGVVQQLLNLPGGAELKVTIAKWYTPNGYNINQQGITPDKVVALSIDDQNAGRDPQLDAAKSQLGF